MLGQAAWRCLILAVVLVPCAWSQAGTGSVSGTVRDQNNAFVPNAKVEIVNGETNVTSTTRTNETGFYLFPSLITGSYRLSIEVSGMEKYEVTCTVLVAQSMVVDPMRRVG